MAHPGVGAAPPDRSPEAPAHQEQDDIKSTIELYHMLDQLDPAKKFPPDLVQILVRAAIRDPAITLEIDGAIRSRDVSAQEAPLHPQYVESGPSMGAAHTEPTPGVPAASTSSSDATVTSAPVAPAPRGQKRAAQGGPSVSPPPRRLKTESSVQTVVQLRFLTPGFKPLAISGDPQSPSAFFRRSVASPLESVTVPEKLGPDKNPDNSTAEDGEAMEKVPLELREVAKAYPRILIQIMADLDGYLKTDLAPIDREYTMDAMDVTRDMGRFQSYEYRDTSPRVCVSRSPAYR
ncbi:hypothetical protein PG994_000737 [Apiospora phragmitis]|uniref:Uncharacterized protein n=1 Tax=Apiospora phragmitis TaxID=2905665 RepID=A0ABR1X7C7_9PEZI